jgi:NAD-dependent deacetylase
MIKNIPPPPRCKCDAVLKPNVVLFGETPPYSAMEEANKEAYTCDIILIIGTSGIIYPAANIPFIAYKNKATIIEINTEPCFINQQIKGYFINEKAEVILPKIVEKIKEKISNHHIN